MPLIFSGKNIPSGKIDHGFCFFTDIAPTIYEVAELPTSPKEGYAPITGKSMLPHIQNPTIPIYTKNEGIGLEAGNSAAYFLGDYKIVKNNKPLGDKQWKMYNLKNDPCETNDISAQKTLIFQQLLCRYEAFAKEVGVLLMPPHYDPQSEVGKKSIKAVINPLR
ncbi:MAG: hypothetical protein AB8H47_23405 [Bacteroidia bacterium]